MRRLLAALLLLLPTTAWAQVTPSFPGGITPPLFGSPASAVNGGGQLSTTCLAWPLGTNLCEDAANVLGQRTSTSAQRFNIANTYTSATNNESFSVDWQTQANSALIGTRTAATGTARRAYFSAQTSNAGNDLVGLDLTRGNANPIRLGHFSVGGVVLSQNSFTTFVSLGETTNTATSGTFINTAILPTYNQASGNAANTDLLVNRTQTAVGSGAQYLFQAQVGSSDRFRVDTTGSAATAGANGQVFTNVQSLTELTTIAAAATTDTTIQMPANSVVLGVSVRVTTVIPTAATFTVGDSGSAARFSTAAVAVAANSTDPGTKAGPYYNASALSVRITPNLTPGANTGRVRVTIYYYTITPPTS